MTTSRDLAGVPEQLFERVWEFVKACDDREKHFNELQSHYRTLASTWLLAAFAGVGLAFSKDLEWGAPREAIAMAIALAGAVGVTLLWVVDVLVYHELLIASYVAGSKLERAFPWLPPVRSHFSQPKKHMAVRWYIGGFYIAGVVVLCFVATLMGLLGQSTRTRWWLVPLLVGAGLTTLICVVTRRAVRWKEALSVAPWIGPDNVASAAEQRVGADGV